MDWTGIKLYTAPAIEPVTAAELRDYLRLDDTSQDTMLDSLIKGAREAVEKQIHRTLITTVWRLYFDEFPDEILLIRPPIQSVDAIKYIDTDGTEQELTSYKADIISEPARIQTAYGENWPSTRTETNAVYVEYTAGYGDTGTDVPAALLTAIKALAADIYEHPEDNVELNLSENRTINRLLAGYYLPEIY